MDLVGYLYKNNALLRICKIFYKNFDIYVYESI